MSNPLVELHSLGQSVWFDSISRRLIVSGELLSLIENDGLRGLTSNPAIFEKAISGSSDYTQALRALARTGKDAKEIYEAIAIEDIQWVADLLRPVYDASEGRDGYVSLEVSPNLASDTSGTVREATRLAAQVDRENLMIKVPGTAAGMPAIEQLIGDGINVNVTVLFAVDNYVQAAEAYLGGLEALAAKGGPLGSVSSVASFFISRIDSMVDDILEQKAKEGDGAARSARLLMGKVAIANAKIAYQAYNDLCQSERWKKLADKGARTQRLLWGSTSTKNPEYRDVMYVEELIGPDTVNTMPEATLKAFRDHGVARATIEDNVDGARATMTNLDELDISIDEVTAKLQMDAVRLFEEPFNKLLGEIESQRGAIPKRA